jgi:hypothetical protein
MNLLLLFCFQLSVDDEPANGFVGNLEIGCGVLDVDIAGREARDALRHELEHY